MSQPLPTFRYHPDPVGTGNIVAREMECGVCGKVRDHAYIGPYACPEPHFENGDVICPWCIADGSAAAAWKASFAAPEYLSDLARATMTADALAELEQRTPSFLCIQQDRWLDHHGEACAYLGEVGAPEYADLPEPAQQAVREVAGDNLADLRADGDGPTVYLFACLHCPDHVAFYAGP